MSTRENSLPTMEYNSGVSLILPDSIGSMENDYDEEDIVHEQTNQNEIVELIMAAFQGHGELSDEDDDDESFNTTDSSHNSSEEQQILNLNNNNIDEQYIQQQNELRHQQSYFSSPTISISPPIIPRNDLHGFQITNNQEEVPFNSKNHIVHYQNPVRPSSNTPTTAFHYVPTMDITDPMQTQYLNDTQNQLNKLRILCSVKDRKASQLQNLCEEFREKYESDTRALKHQLELSERSKYDCEQKHQLIHRQYEELIETNKKLQRTVKDSELKVQQLESTKTQFEKKFSDSESLIESLHRKVSELQQFESIARSQHDYELILSTLREKHDQEILSLNEKLHDIQMNFQEKNIEVGDLRSQLELANKNTEMSIFERMETVNLLNEQLHDCQRKYTDLLTTTSTESIHQKEMKQQLIHRIDEKENLETKCHELESEIRTLRERLHENESLSMNSRDSLDLSVFDQSIINENLLLKERINEYVFKDKQLRAINEELQHQIDSYPSKRSDSSSSSSSSNETVITTGVHMEQIRKLTNQIENLKKDLLDLEEKHEYEKQELHTIIEQLREDVNEVDKTKQLYIDVCQEKNSIEDTVRSKVEYEFKVKLDDLHRTFEQENQILKNKSNEDLEQLYQEIERMKIKHERQITELNNELDRLRTNDDLKSRLEYTEKEFEQLKHDYYHLNLKQSELLKTCASLENDNENLFNSIEQIQREKVQLTSQQKQDLVIQEENFESLRQRIKNYENVISQYEDYRIKLENNLQKITQQRDTNKVELRLAKEMLTNNDLQRDRIRTEKEEKLFALEEKKNQLEQRLQEANRALDLADSHLQQEIEKIKISLEQEYNRRYERDQKQHQQSTINFSNNSLQDTEDIKKIYRTEIDRLYHENIELSQHQTKLIDTHQKQMQIMKKDLDDGYNNVINEFQREQIRLQTRYDQLKQQFNDAQQTIEQLKLNLNHSEETFKIPEEYHNTREHDHRFENLVKLLEQSNDVLNQERTSRTRQENEHKQIINSLQKKISNITKHYTKIIDDLKRELAQEHLTNQTRPISVPDFSTNNLTSKDIKSDYLTTVEKLRELFTSEMISLLRLTCKMIFDVHHRVTVARCMDNLDMSMKKQIQNELIRSRNSMIKEIRREIFDKLTFALRSQGMPDNTIDTHIFELDRLLSQMVQDCLNSLPTFISPSSSNSTILSLHITAPTRPIISQSSSSRKSIECLYITPIANKKPAPLAPHCQSTLDLTGRTKSASNVFLLNEDTSHTNQLQRSTSRNSHMKMHRSEDDILLAIQRTDEQRLDFDNVTLSENQMDPKIKYQTSDIHYPTTQIINHKIQEYNDEELTWPQQPISITQSNGIKKFVRNSLKLFITSPQQQKRTGK